MILAHKGDTLAYSSSTKESVLSALNKCDGVELDLNVSKDGVFYFYHEGDWTSEILARQYSFAEVGQFVPIGESVLNLREALGLVKRLDKHLLIHAEIGGGGRPWAEDFSDREVEDILDIIQESGVSRRLVLFHTVNSAKMFQGHIVFRRNILRRRYGMYRLPQLAELLPYIDASTTMAYVIRDEREVQGLLNHGIGYIVTDRLGNRAKHADNGTYYRRAGPSVQAKKAAIRDFVLAKDDIKFILDVGCNNGDMSHQFIQHGIRVLGVDTSSDLEIPAGYDFVQWDITKAQRIIINDCTLFLSLYHHLFCDGPGVADRLFYKLLLRTEYLVFDCGNVQERGDARKGWVQRLKKHFCSEKELLDHFAVEYAPIGMWNTGGASRTIVVFEREAFDNAVEIIEEFRRGIGAATQGRGLTPIAAIDEPQSFYPNTIFYKLRLGNTFFFAKKHLRIERHWAELEKIIEVYDHIPREELLEFYGVSERFGLIYEWVDDFSYRGKLRAVSFRGVHLSDADVIKVGQQLKVIDFA